MNLLKSKREQRRITWATLRSSALKFEGPGIGGTLSSRSSNELREVRGEDIPEPVSESLSIGEN